MFTTVPMRLLIVSDLHLEFLRHENLALDAGERATARRNRRIAIARSLGFFPGGWFPGFEIDAANADVIVLAGDIDVGYHGVEWAIVESLAECKPLIYVAGNHEFYGHSSALVSDMKRIAADSGAPVYVLEQDAVVLDGVRFLGTTLWSDMRAGGDQATAVAMCTQMITDYRAIVRTDRTGLVNAEETMRWHHNASSWLQVACGESFHGPTVVVTHHAPSLRSAHPQFGVNALSGAFMSDCEHLTAGVALWIHGHTHACVDYVLPTGCRVISNQRGYPFEGLRGYTTDLVVAVEATGE